VQHIPGKANALADALLRPSGINQEKDDNQGVVILPLEKFITIAIAKAKLDEQTKRSIMTLVHDHHTAGNPGRDEMIHKAQQYTQWEGMNQWIADYVKGCTTCQ